MLTPSPLQRLHKVNFSIKMNNSCCFSTSVADNEEASACENENDLTDQLTAENILFFHTKI